MSAAARRLEFAPPPAPGLLGALLLALIAHSLLAGALAWGVQWRHKAEAVRFEAELWAALPQEAAPALEPPPPPVVVAPAPSLPSEAEIALEQEKKRQTLEKQQQEEQEKARLLALREKERLAAVAKKVESQRLQALQTAEDARQREVQRQENLARISGMAGVSGAPAKSAGPSAGYGARVRTRVRPNIVFSENPPNNPAAEVEVRTAPDGTIIARKLIKSSGIRSFDEAVLRAIDKTGEFPQDVDGKVPPAMIISFRPKDSPF